MSLIIQTINCHLPGHLLVVQFLVPLVAVAEFLNVLGQLRVVLVLVLSIQLGDLDLLPDLWRKMEVKN